MTPAETEALRATLRDRIVMTSEPAGTFTVTVVEVEATPAEGASIASGQLASIARTLSELDALADRGVDVRDDLRPRWLAHRAEALRQLSRYTLALLRLRREALASGLDALADRIASTLDALADQLGAALSALSIASTSTLAPPRSLRPVPVWPAPTLAPPTRSRLRHRWERPT